MIFDTQEVLASLQRLMDEQDEYIKEWQAKIRAPWWRRFGHRWLDEWRMRKEASNARIQ